MLVVQSSASINTDTSAIRSSASASADTSASADDSTALMMFPDESLKAGHDFAAFLSHVNVFFIPQGASPFVSLSLIINNL